MLATSRAEMADLRRLMDEIEARGGGKAHAVGEPAARRLKLARSLDPAMGGGLADNALSEIVPAEPMDGAAAMGFALALAARFLIERPSAALLIGESFASREMGALYGPGLVAHGLSLNRLVFVEAPDANTALWAIEEALKSGGPAVVLGELWGLKGYGLAASRRLLLAAHKGRTPALLVLASAHGQAQRMTSAADARFEIVAARSPRSSAAAGKDLPGPFAFGARLVKARLGFPRDGPSEALDATRIVRLEWRSEARCFDDPAISLSLAAASGDRSRAAPQRR
jgi:protein ImuA